MDEKCVKIKVDGGTYFFKLNAILHQKNISKNQLVKDTNTDFKVVKRLARGEVIRIDIYVLSRLCNYLNCSVEDIIEYRKEQ